MSMSAKPYLLFFPIGRQVLKLAALFLFLLFLGMDFSQASSEYLKGVRLFNCADSKCVRLNAERASRSYGGGLYVFGKAQLTLLEFSNSRPNEGLPKIVSTFDGVEGYYDSIHNLILLKGLEGRRAKEVLLDLSTGKVQYF